MNRKPSRSELLLRLIRENPGKNALELRNAPANYIHVGPMDGRLLKNMQTDGLIEYRNEGWRVTAKGDLRLLSLSEA